MKRLCEYVKYIDRLLQRDDLNWEEEAKKHKDHMEIFRHGQLVNRMELIAGIISFFIMIYAFPTFFSFVIAMGVIIVYAVILEIENSKIKRIDAQYDEMMKRLGEAFYMSKKY